MSDVFPTQLGRVMLVEEGGGDPFAGIIVGSSDDTVILNLTTAAPPWHEAEVHASVFGPEALYRATANATVRTDKRMVLSDVRDVETVQRRRWPRRQLNVPVILLTVGTPAAAGIAGETVDLGVGGTCVHTTQPVPRRADPTVRFTLPGGELLMLPARVVDAAPSDAGYDYRLAFRDLADEDASRLAQIVGRMSA